MSHVVSIETKLTDLGAVKAACARMGWQFCEGQETFKWYGTWVGDYNAEDAAFKLGIKPEDYGKCDHAIRVPGASYEIGLLVRDGNIVPVWDFYGSGGLQKVLPDNGMNGFLQAYAVERAKMEARRKGHSVSERKLEDGRVQLTVRT